MTELGRMIATKQVSPVEVVRAHLDRIATYGKQWRSDLSKFDAALKTLH